MSQNSYIRCWSNAECRSFTHSPPPPDEQALREMHFQRRKWEQQGRHCSALAAQLLKRKNRYRSSGVFFFFYKELSNACCSWHCHRKWRIILCTLWKKQAQENPNRFNSIWVSLSYFKVGFFFFFFHLCARKRESGQSLSYTPPPFFPLRFLPLFVQVEKWLGWQDKLFLFENWLYPSCFSLILSVSHKLQMQMWLCPFPINSSRQRVSSRSLPHQNNQGRGERESNTVAIQPFSHSVKILHQHRDK